LSIYWGDGSGSFSKETLSVPSGIFGLDSGDFNNDGDMDLVAASFSPGKCYIFLGNGDGTFESPLSLNYGRAFGVSAGDFDNDGDDDIVFGYYPLRFYPNEGNLTFGSPVDLGFGSYAVSECDMNNDGNLDLVTTFRSNLYYSRGNGDGTFTLDSSRRISSTYIYGNAVSPELVMHEEYEGAEVQLTGEFTDHGWLDSHTATIDWGDGSLIDSGSVSEENEWPYSSGQVTGSHFYGDNGEYTITLTVIDDDGGSHSDIGQVRILNAPPISNAGADLIVIVGEEFTLDGSNSYDPGYLDVLTYEWDFGDTNTGSGETPNHSYGSVGTYTATLTVSDDDGASDTDTVTITVITPEEATQELIYDVEALGLDDGIENSFVSKLDNAIKSISNDRPSAYGQLEAFINEVEAQRGNSLTNAQADELIATAQRIKDNI
jgi:PKD repeat protein